MMTRNQPISIVVVDDEKYICNIIVEALSSEKYDVRAFSDPALALTHIEQNPVDLVLTDLVMGEHTGVQVLETALASHGDATVILMTAHPTVQTAISVLRKGAYDFLVKPFRLELLKATIKRGLEHQQVVRENLHLKGQVEFLKVAGAANADIEIDDFLAMVARSCRKEMDATAVGIIETDPQTKEVVRKIYAGEEELPPDGVLDNATVDKFTYTRSSKPSISKDEIDADGETRTRIWISQPIFVRRRFHGVINLLIESRFDRLTPGEIDVLAILANSAAAAIANYRHYEDLHTSYLQAIKGLANAIEARDQYTAGHTDRVTKLAELIARQLGWDERRIEHLIMGCTLHDIGKLGVPDGILNKPDRLTDEERRKMQTHPELGLKIIDGIDLFRPAVPYIIAHHEWYDGSGYPRGLKGEGIPIEGRLLTVADTLDAILSDRPYRKGADLEVAVNELVKYRSTQFDPAIVDVLLDLLRQGEIDFAAKYGREMDVSKIAALKVSEKASV
ncbi:MAG: response regulator [candidate division Zixibacteria bacterium]|nr:response regulator [candidate division Zixibacteria bacterium]MDH3936092.1 response regulator [candidate division Zixibacteria bacterium]MDH4032238.1 response regulator [candidate division Zixibacteria bacterium]